MGHSVLRIGLLPFLLLVACRGVETSYRYPEDLSHPDYVKRSLATRDFAVLRDRSQLPRAFDLLKDPEGQIRAIAHQTLRAMMPDGVDFGYDASLPEYDRDRIANAWRAWWEAGGEKPPESPPVGAPGG